MILQQGDISTEHHMVVKEHGNLTINDGAALISTPFTRVVLEKNANYLNFSSSSPQLEVQRTITGQEGWRMVAAPVQTTYSDMFSGFVTQGFLGSSYPAKQPNLLWYDETDTGTDLQSWRMPGNLTDTVQAGLGHFQYVFNGAGITGGGAYPDALPIIMTSRGTETLFHGSSFNYGVTFTPQPTPGSSGIYVESAEEGWNLLGNPTASTIDWESATGWTRQNMDDAIYLWDPAANSGAGEYKYRSGGLGTLPNGKIAPYQAFWVRTNNTSPQLTMNNDAKSRNGVFLRKEGPTVDIPLVLTVKEYKASAFLSFNSSGNPGIDSYDAYRLEPMNDTWLELFTLGSTTDHYPLVINNLPELGATSFHIPLYVGSLENGQPIPGTYRLSWSVPSSWPADWNISLHDHSLKTAVNMVNRGSYLFDYLPAANARMGNTGDEFIMPGQVLTPISKTSNAKIASELPGFSIIINQGKSDRLVDYISLNPQLLPNYPNPFTDHTTVRISVPREDEIALSILDLQGRKVADIEKRVYQAGVHEIKISGSELPSGIYLLQLSTTESQHILKINKF
ncbi:MAG TPA: T9SS type A sorting domain-containing protein [Bacteroidales bacterium]|nr:T9SS type A sorting domain-containing protein [Bacteroidales bacterium]